MTLLSGWLSEWQALVSGGKLKVESSSAADQLSGDRIKVETSFADNATIDAFGRLRVSDPVTLFSHSAVYDKGPMLWAEKEVGTTTITHNANDATVDLTIGTASGDRIVRQTRAYYHYQPGKAPAHGEPVLTPTGWEPIERLHVGDEVFDGLGEVTEVIGVYPQGEREIYRLTFDDGTHVDADEEHLWKTVVRTGKRARTHRVLTTKQMLKEAGENPKGFKRWRIPASPVLSLPEKPVPIDPYTLGVILGDGHIDQYGHAVITNPLRDLAKNLVGEISTLSAGSTGCPRYGVLKSGAKLRSLGLAGTKAATKFVPHVYLYNSADIRLAILRGLMDTDGTADKRNGNAEFNSASRQLAEDVAFLVRSLGGQAKIRIRDAGYKNRDGEYVRCLPTHRVRVILPVCPFLTDKKASIWSPRERISFDRYVHKIKPVGKSQATCIRVASDDHTFLTRNHVVTHNSQYIKITGAFGTAQANTTKYMGYGDDNNGVFFGQDSTGIFVLLRSSVTGSVSDARKVYQSEWNVDTMDGTGPSGINADFTKARIYIADLEWLGVGRVRVGLVIAGKILYCHEFLNSGLYTTTYMTTASLPVRYEIVNTDTALSSSTLKQICSEVESEGGVQADIVYPFSQVVTGVSLGNGIANILPIIAIRMATTFNSITNRMTVVPGEMQLVANSGTAVGCLRYNPTITGGTWVAADANSGIEVNTTGTAVTGGMDVKHILAPSGTGPKDTGSSGSASMAGRLPFGLDVDGANPTTMALCAYGVGAGVTAEAFLQWSEVH